MAILHWKPETSLRTWDPFTEFEGLTRRMEQLFDELFPRTREARLSERLWTPAVEVYEKDNSYIVEVDLPGLKKDDVSITVEENTLSIQGERKLKSEIKEEDFHRSERFYGKFTRSFLLPNNVDREKIQADFTDGILTIELPKREVDIKRTVKIK